MSETYDLYSSVHAIAKSIVTQSKGFGFQSFDADKIHADVDTAASVAKVANDYWQAQGTTHKALDRLRAAKTLGLPTREFEDEYERERAVRDELVLQMKEIVSGYEKTYTRGWTKRQ